jgi:hypothetical protein
MKKHTPHAPLFTHTQAERRARGAKQRVKGQKTGAKKEGKGQKTGGNRGERGRAEVKQRALTGKVNLPRTFLRTFYGPLYSPKE